MQEISIKLKADTTMAEKSVKDLETKIKGMTNANKSNGDSALISDDDVKNFQKMNQEFEKFTKSLGTINSKLQQNMNQQQQQAQKGGLSGFLQSGFGRQMVGSAVSTLSVGNLISQIRQGMDMIKNEEQYSANLGTRIGGYGSDFRRTRLDMTATGSPFNKTSMETMMVADAYMSLAGNRNIRGKTSDILYASKSMGLDENYLAGAYGSFSKMGTQDLQKMSESIAGAIKKTGMGGRENELIDALNRLTDSAYQNQLSISDQERNNLLSTMTYFGTKNSSLKGEKGAQLAGGLDNLIKSSTGNDELLTIMGYGSKYKGVQGYWELQQKLSKGLTDPSNLKDLMSGLNTWQADPDMKKIWLHQQLQQQGVNNPEMVDFLMRPDIQKDIQSGKITKETLDSIGKTGKSSLDKQFKDRMKSNTEQRSSWDVWLEDMKKSLSEPIDYLKHSITEMITGMSPEAGAGLLTTGTLGGTLAGGALMRGGFNKFFGIGKGGGTSGGLSGFAKSIKGGASSLWGSAKSFAGGVGKGLSGVAGGLSGLMRMPQMPFIPLPEELLEQFIGGNSTAMIDPRMQQTGLMTAYGYGSGSFSKAYGYGSTDSTRTLEAKRSDILDKEMDVLNKRESVLSLESGSSSSSLGQMEKVVSRISNSTQSVANRQASVANNGMMNLMRLNAGGSAAVWSGATAAVMQGATNNVATLKVNVGGSIDGLTPENNTAVATTLAKKIENMPDLSQAFKQGATGVTL